MAQIWYEHMDLLGSGTFGEVFRVINKIDGQNYALKVIKCYSNAEIERALDESELRSDESVGSRKCSEIVSNQFGASTIWSSCMSVL